MNGDSYSGNQASGNNEDIPADSQNLVPDKQAAGMKEDNTSSKHILAAEKNCDEAFDEHPVERSGDLDPDEHAAEEDVNSDPDRKAAEKDGDSCPDGQAVNRSEDLESASGEQTAEKGLESGKEATERDEADKVTATNTRKPKTQSHWDIEEFPIFLRRETYQAIVANRTKTCTIKKWMRYCNLTSLKNNVKNKEALLKHLATIENGHTRASTSIISGLVEKLVASSIEQELTLHNVDWDPEEQVSVASKKLLLRTTLNRRQEHFHDGSKRRAHLSSNSKPRGTQAGVSAPELLEDNSSDSSSAEEDEDVWDSPEDRSSKNEKILQYLKKPNGTATKVSNKAAKTNKTKKATTNANKKTCELNEQRGKITPNCTNCGNNEGALKILESSILRLQEEINRQKVNMDHMAKQLLEQQSNKNTQDYPKSKSNDDFNSIKKLFEQKTKTIFDTINVQQTCLDQIIESISKNEKMIYKLRNKVESTVTSNQQAHDDHKEELRKMADTMRSNEKVHTEMKKQIGASTTTNTNPGNALDTTSQVPQNLITQLNVINSKLDLLSEKSHQAATQQNQVPAQMSMLLAMTCALWRENHELKMKDINRSRKPVMVEKPSDEILPTAESKDFLIKEKEMEAKSKTEHSNRRRHKKDQVKSNKKKSEVSSQVNVPPAAQNHILLPSQAVTVSPQIGETTEIKKVLLETPVNSQDRIKMLDIVLPLDTGCADDVEIRSE
ncbi:hypothetical protein ACHWQZ_G011344 [Mnemiopsis leidyi]